MKESGVSLNRNWVHSSWRGQQVHGVTRLTVTASFPKSNFCMAVFFSRECLRKNRFQWRSHQFTKENAQHVAIGLIESSRRHGFCSCCESWRHLGSSCWHPSSIITIHLAHAVVYTCEVAALHRQVTDLNRKGDSSSLEGLRSQKSLARSSCKESSIRDPFIHLTNINTICSAVLEPVGTQLLVKLKNTVAESDVTFK